MHQACYAVLSRNTFGVSNNSHCGNGGHLQWKHIFVENCTTVSFSKTQQNPRIWRKLTLFSQSSWISMGSSGTLKLLITWSPKPSENKLLWPSSSNPKIIQLHDICHCVCVCEWACVFLSGCAVYFPPFVFYNCLVFCNLDLEVWCYSLTSILALSYMCSCQLLPKSYSFPKNIWTYMLHSNL